MPPPSIGGLNSDRIPLLASLEYSTIVISQNRINAVVYTQVWGDPCAVTIRTTALVEVIAEESSDILQSRLKHSSDP